MATKSLVSPTIHRILTDRCFQNDGFLLNASPSPKVRGGRWTDGKWERMSSHTGREECWLEIFPSSSRASASCRKCHYLIFQQRKLTLTHSQCFADRFCDGEDSQWRVPWWAGREDLTQYGPEIQGPLDKIQPQNKGSMRYLRKGDLNENRKSGPT